MAKGMGMGMRPKAGRVVKNLQNAHKAALSKTNSTYSQKDSGPGGGYGSRASSRKVGAKQPMVGNKDPHC